MRSRLPPGPRILGAFTASQAYADDADYSPTSWLIHRTRITKSARGHLGWARRAVTHPKVLTALAEGSVVSASMARLICAWTDKLPGDCRAAADDILLAAARAGARRAGARRDCPAAQAALAAEIYARSLPEPGDDPEPAFDGRQLRVETTFAGTGVITGDLTPECAAVVTAVLESLSAPMGAEDTRSREQRYHDALEEAMRRLVTVGLLPERAGQPVKVWAHISLAELLALDDGSVLAGEWIAEMAARWAANRAAASDGEGGSWGPGWPGRACRSTSGTRRASRRASGTRSSCGTGAAAGPAAAPSPRRPARSTTSGTWPTAGRPAWPTACSCAPSTIRW